MWQRDFDGVGRSPLRYLRREEIRIAERTDHVIGVMPDNDDRCIRVQCLGCSERVRDEWSSTEFMERFGESGSHPRPRTSREDHHGERWGGFVGGMWIRGGHEAHSHRGGAVRAPWRVPAWLAD